MNRGGRWFKKILVSVIFFLFVTLSITNTSFVSAVKIIKSYDLVDNNDNSEFIATGFFHLEQKDDIWWFIDPDGEKFYSLGIAYVLPGDFFYGNITEWAETTRTRLETWGFNTLNGEFYDLFPDMPYIYKLRFMDIIAEDGWSQRRMPDVFDKGWRNKVTDIINETADLLRNDSNLIGYQTDNEMKWGPNPVEDTTLLEVFMAAGENTAGKKKTVEFLKNRYNNNTESFNNIWKMNIVSFNDLFGYTKFGVKGYKITNGQGKEDIDSFSRLVAKTYFNFTSTVLKKADPNHLNLGVRFFFQGVPQEVLEECGKHVDVISINYYRENVLIYDPETFLYSKLMDCVTLDNWMQKYHIITGKPLLVSEFSFTTKDSIWPIFDKKELVSRGIMSSSKYAYTQEGRADLFEWYAKRCLNAPYMIGHTWFSYMDKLNVVNMGIVNIWNEPYKPLVDRMAKINKKAVELHGNATKKITDIDKEHPILNEHNIDILSEKYFGSSSEITISYYIKTSDTQNFNQKYINTYHKNILYVGGTGFDNFTRIQDAIDCACNNDIIYVHNGVYQERLQIDKPLELMGENKKETIIVGDYSTSNNQDPVIQINSDNVTITGFTITSEGGYFHDYFHRSLSGITIEMSDNCIIQNNILYNISKYGIRIRQSNNNNINNNIIYNVLDKLGCNIQIDSAKNTKITNNSLWKNTICCIWISRSNSILVQGNLISHSYYAGIILERVENTKIKYNTIQENEHTAIILKNSNNNIISYNNFLRKNEQFLEENPSKLKFNRRLAFFQNSKGNIWDKNYWDQYRILPKIILGKKGNNALSIELNIDWHPSKKQYEIIGTAEVLFS